MKFKSLKNWGVRLSVILGLVALSVHIDDPKKLQAAKAPVAKKEQLRFKSNLKSLKVSSKINKLSPELKSRELVKLGLQKIVRFKSSKLSWATKESIIVKAGGTPLRRLSSINAVMAYFPKGKEAKLKRDRRVKSVRTDAEVKMHVPNCAGEGANCTKVAVETPKAVKDDIHWNIDKVNARDGWEVPACNTVRVCVIDSGIDSSHPDLATISKGGLDVSPQADEMDTENVEDALGHGTHVNGIIAALPNDLGTAGVAVNVELYQAKVFGTIGFTSAASILAGVEYCKEIGADVINMSLGGGSSEEYEEVIGELAEDGVIVVASAGNSGRPGYETADTVSYPAKLTTTIAVAASDENDKFAEFSSAGPTVDVIAPGTTEFHFTHPSTGEYFDKGIFSTLAGQYLEEEANWGDDDQIDGQKRFGRLSGTSMAAPHVAGAAAVLKSLNRSIDVESFRTILKNTSKDIGLPEYQQGKGRLDLGEAIAYL